MEEQTFPRISWVKQTAQVPCDEGEQNIFRARSPQRVLANFTNIGGVSINLNVVAKDQTHPLVREVLPGADLLEEFEGVSSIDIVPSDAEGRREDAMLTFNAVLLFAREQAQASRAFSCFFLIPV